jgi:hypothetical protein
VDAYRDLQPEQNILSDGRAGLEGTSLVIYTLLLALSEGSMLPKTRGESSERHQADVCCREDIDLEV